MSKNILGKSVICGLTTVYFLLLFILALNIKNYALSTDEGLRIDEAIRHPGIDGGIDLAIDGAGFHDDVNVMVAVVPLQTEVLLNHLLPNSRMRGSSVGDRLLAVVCEGNKLVLMERDEEGSSSPISTLVMPEKALSLVLTDDMVLAGLSRNGGVVQVDISDFKAPKVTRHYHFNGTIVDMLIQERTVYLLDLNYGLCRVNLDQSEPKLERLEPIKSPWRIVCVRDRLVVGSLDNTLTLFDIDPAGSVDRTAQFMVADSVRGLAYCAGYLGVALKNGDLMTFDLSTWPLLRQADKLKLKGQRPHQLTSVSGQALMIASLAGSGLTLVELSSTGHLTLRKNLLWPRQFIDLEVYEDVIYAESYDGLELFSLPVMMASGPSVTTMVSAQALLPFKWGGQLFGQRGNELIPLSSHREGNETTGNDPFWLANGKHLIMYQLTTDGNTKRVAEVECGNSIRDLVQRENQLFVLFHEGLKVFDWDSSGQLFERSAVQLPERSRNMAWLDPGYLLITAKDSLLRVLDVRQVERPFQISQLSAPSHLNEWMVANSMVVDDRYAYLALGRGGVGVVDLSDPTMPRLVATYLTRGYAKDLFFSDGLLWVADLKAGIYLMRVVSPGLLQRIGSLQTPIVATRVTTHLGELFLNNRDGLLVKFPMPLHAGTLRSDSRSSARVKLPDEIRGKAVKVYLFDGQSTADVVLPAEGAVKHLAEAD